MITRASLTTGNWRRVAAIWALLGLAMLVVAAFAPLVGATRIDYARAFGSGVAEGELNTDAIILFGTRLPRVLFGLVAGSALAVAGAVYQALLRNDLADPYTLGVSGGSAFGALLVISLAPAWGTSLYLPAVTFFFALGSVLTINGLSQWRFATPSASRLILAGVTLNMIYSAGILLVQYLSDPYRTLSMIRWMMGGLDVTSWSVLTLVAFVTLAGSAVIIWQARTLNLLSLGEMTAANLGVDVTRQRRLLLVVSSLMASTVVAYAGPIGFIGLIIPHMMRLAFGPDHRVLVVCCALAGGPFLVLCDSIGRSVMGATELPVGIITSLLGAPFFFWLLFRKAN
jgi:iron complex transport system permease protein